MLKTWEVATGREVKTFSRRDVRGAAFTPDGRYVLSGNSIGTLALWDVQTGMAVKTFTANSDLAADKVSTRIISPDGRYAATSHVGGKTLLWDMSSGREVRSFGRSGFAREIAFSHDSRYLAAKEKDALTLWDVTTGEVANRYEALDGGHIAFSSDGRHAVDAGGGKVTLWEPGTGRILQKTAEPFDVRLGYAPIFSPDGRHLFTAPYGKNTIEMWEVPSLHRVRTFTGPATAERSLGRSLGRVVS